MSSAVPNGPDGATGSMASVYLQLLGATTIWAVTFHVGRYAAQHADPLGVAFLRFAVAGVTLAAIVRLLRLARPQWPLVVALAIPGVVAYTLFFFASVQTISGSRAALIAAANPVVVELAAIIALGIGASQVRWAGILPRRVEVDRLEWPRRGDPGPSCRGKSMDRHSRP